MPKAAKRPYPAITEDEFVDKHGEVMRQCDVAKLLNHDSSTICLMCADGRLDTVGPKKQVLVRSLYAYLYPPRGKRLRIAR